MKNLTETMIETTATFRVIARRPTANPSTAEIIVAPRNAGSDNAEREALGCAHAIAAKLTEDAGLEMPCVKYCGDVKVDGVWYTCTSVVLVSTEAPELCDDHLRTVLADAIGVARARS